MQLAPRDPARPFVAVKALQPAVGPVPDLEDAGREGPDATGLVTVRYHGTVDGRATRFSVRNDPFASGERWSALNGSFDDAVRAARHLAMVDGYADLPQAGRYARTSVAVLDAGEGRWLLHRMSFPEGMRDGMDAIISMPVDRIPASRSDLGVPYGRWGARPFDVPDRITVRFDDDRVAALVGVDSIALAPR